MFPRKIDNIKGKRDPPVFGRIYILNPDTGLPISPTTEPTLSGIKSKIDLLQFDSENRLKSIVSGSVNILDGAGNIINPAKEPTLSSIKSKIDLLQFDAENRLKSVVSGGVNILDGAGNIIDPTKESTQIGIKKAIGGILALDLTQAPDGDKTYSSNTTLTKWVYQFNNLTINSGVTLTLKSNSLIMVKGTLTLNGTIRVPGANPGGGTGSMTITGGRCGGSLILIANEIVGTGVLDLSGENGDNGAAPPGGDSAGYDGVAGEYLGGTFGDAAKGGAQGTSIPQAGGAGGKGLKDWLLPSIDLIWNGTFCYPLLTAKSGSGAGPGHNDAYYAGGGGGGACIGDGGKGGDAGSTTEQCGGCGGGAGGFLGLMTNSLSAITIKLNGGNGGAAYGDGGGGGGGGGGFGAIFADTFASGLTINVNGGAGGSGGNPGEAGQPGLALVFKLSNFFEILTA